MEPLTVQKRVQWTVFGGLVPNGQFPTAKTAFVGERYGAVLAVDYGRM